MEILVLKIHLPVPVLARSQFSDKLRRLGLQASAHLKPLALLVQAVVVPWHSLDSDLQALSRNLPALEARLYSEVLQLLFLPLERHQVLEARLRLERHLLLVLQIRFLGLHNNLLDLGLWLQHSQIPDLEICLLRIP